MTENLTERRAREVLCRELPVLRARARGGQFEDELEDRVKQITGGTSALAAWDWINNALYADDDESPFRAGSNGIFVEMLPPVEQVEGGYVCPDEVCPRSEGLDPLGRPPRCALSGKLMRFTM